MPRLTKKEWTIVKYACNCLWDSLDVTNGELRNRTGDSAKQIFKENEKDMKTLERIVEKINKTN